MLQVCYLFVYC